MKTVYNTLTVKLDGKNLIDLLQEVLAKLNELETRINRLDRHVDRS